MHKPRVFLLSLIAVVAFTGSVLADTISTSPTPTPPAQAAAAQQTPAQPIAQTPSQVQQAQPSSSTSSAPLDSFPQIASQLQSQADAQGNALTKNVPNASISQLVNWLDTNLWNLYGAANKLISPYAFFLFLAGLGVLIFPNSRARRIGLWWVITVVIGYAIVELSPSIFAMIINKTKSIGG